MSDNDKTVINILKTTRERLGSFADKNTSWDELLNELMDLKKKEVK